jgi:hypothetical protein
VLGVLTRRWQKPTRSTPQGANCVEARRLDDVVEVRNSNNPGPVVTFTIQEWRTFRDAVRLDNEFAV